MTAQRQRKAASRDRHGQGRGNLGPDARSGTILLSNTGPGSEDRAHHELGRWCVRIHAQPGADWPLYVPQIAEMRPTSRQRMQRLADELAAEGLVEFIDNPRHRRSKLVRLTRKGEARYRELSARFLAIASTMGAELSEADIRKTTEIVRQLSDEAKGESEQK